MDVQDNNEKGKVQKPQNKETYQGKKAAKNILKYERFENMDKN